MTSTRYLSFVPASLVQRDENRPAGRALIARNTTRDQTFDDVLAGLLFFAFIKYMIELHVHHAVDVIETFQRPAAGLFPQCHQFGVMGFPALEQRPDGLLDFGIGVEKIVRFGVDAAQPLDAIRARFFPGMVGQVVPHPFHHVQADVADVVGAHDFPAGELENVGNCRAQHERAQVTDMESLMRVGLGELDHHAQVLGFTGAEAGAVRQDGIHHLAGIFRWQEVQVQVTLDRLDVLEARGQAEPFRNQVRDLIRALRHGRFQPGTFDIFSCQLEKGGGNAPMPGERDPAPLDLRFGQAEFTANGGDALGDLVFLDFEHGYLVFDKKAGAQGSRWW